MRTRPKFTRLRPLPWSTCSPRRAAAPTKTGRRRPGGPRAGVRAGEWAGPGDGTPTAGDVHMKLYLDTAVYEEIEQAVGWGVVDGVTTNPTLIAKAGHDHEEQVKRISQIIGNVSAECVSEKRDDMVVEGRRLASWHKNVIVKVPLTPDGLGAGKVLTGDGIRINVTLCFSVNQAVLAAAIGAYIVSPFAGRLDDINEDGMRVVADIVSAYRQQEIKTKVLAASIRNPMHVTQAALAGADIATMPFAVVKQLFEHPLTAAGQKRFLEDYRKTQEAKPVQGQAREATAKR